LSLRFCINADAPSVAAAVARNYAACAVTSAVGGPAAVLQICTTNGGHAVSLDGAAGVETTDDNEMLLAAMALVDGGSIDASADDLLLIHASAVMAPAGPLVLVGPSGAGKSTLAAALAMHGWPYVGDEAIGLNETATDVVANPKPLKLDRRSRTALFARAALENLAAPEVAGEMLVAPAAVGSAVEPGPVGAPTAVVQIAFSEAVEGVRVSPLSHADVAEIAADQCFNFARWGGRALDTVAALARSTEGCRLQFGDLGGAVDRLQELFG
jgi:hypothetical protein